MNLLHAIRDFWALKSLPPEPKASRGERTLATVQQPGRQMTWTQNRYEQVRHIKGWKYVAINKICCEFACLTPQAGRILQPEEVTSEKRLSGRILKHAARRKATISTQQHEELELLDSNHRLMRLLKNPNGPDVAWSFFYELMFYLEACGITYIWVVPDQLTGLPLELWVIPAHWVRPILGGEKLISHYEIRPMLYTACAARPLIWPESEVISIAYKNPQSKLDGFSPQQAMAEWSDLAEGMATARLSTMRNASYPSIWVKLDPQSFDWKQEDLDRFKANYRANHQGEYNTGEPIVPPPGAEVQQLGTGTLELGWVQSSDQLRDWELAGYGVSKTNVGINEDVNRATAEAARANFQQNTMRPKVQFIGQVLTEKLAKRFDDNMGIWYDDPVGADPAQELAEDTAMAAAGALTANEWRGKHGLEPYPHGGDDPMLPMGLSPMPWVTGEQPIDFSGLMGGQDPGQAPQQQQQTPEPEEEPEQPPERNGVPSVNGERFRLNGWHKVRDDNGQEHDAQGRFGSGGGSAKPAADKPAAKPSTSDANAGKRDSVIGAAASSLGHKLLSAKDAAKATASRIGQAAWGKLSPKAQARLAKTYAVAKVVEHKLMTGFDKSKELALGAAKERGLSPKHCETVGKVLSAVDLVTAWTVNMPATFAVTGSATAAKVSSWVPVASLAYIGYSTARNPFATIRAAKQLVKAHKSHKGASMEAGDLAGELLERLSKTGDVDQYLALFAAAMDETQDAGKALEVADELASKAEKHLMNGVAR